MTDSQGLYISISVTLQKRDCLVPMGAANPTPNYLGPEPKAIRKVDCHQCSFSFVSGKVYNMEPPISVLSSCILPINLYLVLLSVSPLFYFNLHNQILFISQ